MEKIKMGHKKTLEWLRDISTKNELKEAISYEDTSLLCFAVFELYCLVRDYIENQKDSNCGVIKKDTSELILKFAKYYIVFKAIIRFMTGKIITKQIKNKQSEDGGKYNVLAVSYTHYWRNYPTSQKESEDKEVNQDTMLGGIIKALHKNFNVVSLDEDVSFFIDFKTMVEKRIQRKKELWRAIEVYLTPDIIRKAFKVDKKCKKAWNKLKNDNKFMSSLNYDDFQLSDVFKNYSKRLFGYKIFMGALYTELMKRAIEVEKPDLVLITCGYCQLGRAAVIAGKFKGVPTLEIQHGVIHPYHPAYIHAKDEIASDGSVKSPYCPIPDITAVYGPYHKTLLTEVSVYPEDSVVVTGQPRYDFLSDADKFYSKEKFLSDYKINPNHKIILWTTQCHGLCDEENVKNFEAVFDTMQNLKDITLVIKQHPWEGKRYIKMIQKYLNSYKMNAIITPKDSDTYEQLFVCDLMITRHSTTAMEAVALSKPVIILNLSGEPDPVEYVKEGVALGVYDEKDLNATIDKLLKDDSELAKNRNEYIEKYLYKIDGKATERVVNLIEKMITNRKRAA